MIKTLGLVAVLAVASMSAAAAAPAGGLHRGGAPTVAPSGGLNRSGPAVLNRSFGAGHGVRRHNRFLGPPWIGVWPYETDPAGVNVENNQLVGPPVAYRRVCRTQVVVVPREA